MRNLYLGIDLGTTNSKAAFLDYRELGEPSPTSLKIDQFVERQRLSSWEHLPSVILFEQDGESAYIGEYARRASVNFPDRTVRAIKRLMGKNWKHKVPGWDHPWTPQGISGVILKKIRDQAVDKLHDRVDDLESVTISVPASYGSRQRQATIEAAHLAGFPGTVSLIDEPSAALLHFIFERWRRRDLEVDFGRPNRILVFDMGGGTLDVSLAIVEPEGDRLKVRVLSRSRYTELAGTEFDLRLAAYVVSRLQTAGLNLPDDVHGRRDAYRLALFGMAEPLKIGMSKELTRLFNWHWMREGPPFDIDDPLKVGYKVRPRERELASVDDFEVSDLFVSFDQFSRVLNPFFLPSDLANEDGVGTIYGPIYTALEQASLSKDEIDIVLMHGGMCFLPLIEAGLMQYFPESTLVTKSPEPMTSVAQGAVLYQASRDGRAFDIELQEPALFESIYYEHEGGFALAVDKDHKAGNNGTLDFTIGSGKKRVHIRLYHGFDKNDPLLTHDQDLLIELPRPTAKSSTLQLQWEVKQNRTVEFTWRDPSADNDWQPLKLLSAGRKDSWYPENVRHAERQLIQNIRIL